MAPSRALSRLFRPSICTSCRQTLQRGQSRALASATDPPSSSSPPSARSKKPTTDADAAKAKSSNEIQDLYNLARTWSDRAQQGQSGRPTRRQQTTGLMSTIDRTSQYASDTKGIGFGERAPMRILERDEPHHLHVYAHKHNTHIVLTRPNREPILSYSCGNVGFRKAQRGTFDSGFQLAAYVMRMIQDKGLLRARNDKLFREDEGVGARGRKVEPPIDSLEVCLRGAGKGRLAVTKALLGTEGRLLRERITVVSDDTRLKFGGTRSQNPRRLG